MHQAIEKANVLIEALPYIQRFRGQCVVVKFGGSIMENEAGVRAILEDVAFMECVGLRPVIVHGGGAAISRRMREAHVQPRFVRGLRVSDEQVIRVVEEVLNREVNPHLVRILQGYGGKARGIHGEDILRVQKHTEEHEGETFDWGYVGNVTKVDTEPVKAYLNSEIIPVVTPLGRGPDGMLYNINADEAANAVARALPARKLVFLTDVPGVLRDPDDPHSLISTLSVGEVQHLIDRGVIAGGMMPKVRGAVDSIAAGIRKTHIIDSSLPHSLLLELFTDRGVGTEIVP
ncbi:acetylglutamate kinase [Kiritimatiella glycovorans]|uniref:Acetylglutamate kinase n=1 Tax=Kiritimatiella glycovorans TaxID=1307763 RepID=A0A0G3EBM8_9BACT|nr:acetylglutamate kinase [Kiritimatiella glycovorans]AKJ63718.1 Acetylglutamate kinase [Kiritimatiella glycovorans]